MPTGTTCSASGEERAESRSEFQPLYRPSGEETSEASIASGSSIPMRRRGRIEHIQAEREFGCPRRTDPIGSLRTRGALPCPLLYADRACSRLLPPSLKSF